jgi:uncharacterized protein (DUF1015 family)
MAIIKHFKGLRPPKEIVEDVACLPYDVMNSEEAAKMANGKDASLLRITRAEIEFEKGTDSHSEEVYLHAKSNFEAFQDKKYLIQDKEANYYIYAQTMNGKTQYGIVGCAAVQDYMNNVIKKHELTRKDKEQDRMNHVRVSGMNYEPVFFTYPAVKEIDDIVADVVKSEPEYDFVSEDDFGHHFWLIRDREKINRIVELYSKVPASYVADGHHRTAAAALVGNERKKNNPNHTGKEEYNFFLAVHFPAEQLSIIDYNRVVKDLNGLSEEEFIGKLEEAFEVKEILTGTGRSWVTTNRVAGMVFLNKFGYPQGN